MKIGYIGMEERREYLQRHAHPGTEVVGLNDFTPSVPRVVGIESMWDEYLSIPATLETVEEAYRRGCDAVLTGCFGDPGVDAARELVPIPVIGPGEAAFHTAALLGERFTVLTIMPGTFRPTRHQVQRAGLDGRLASIRSIDTPVLDIRKGGEDVFEKALAICRQALDEDGADVIVLGCASLSHVFGDRLQEELGEPVVNALKNSLKVAEMLVGQRLAHSKRAYPVPPKRLKAASQ